MNYNDDVCHAGNSLVDEEYRCEEAGEHFGIYYQKGWPGSLAGCYVYRDPVSGYENIIWNDVDGTSTHARDDIYPVCGAESGNHI